MAMEIQQKHVLGFTKYAFQTIVAVILLLVAFHGPDKIPHIKDSSLLRKITIIIFMLSVFIEIFEEILRSGVSYRKDQLYKLCARLFQGYFSDSEEALNQQDIFRITVFGIRKKYLVFGSKVLYYLTRYQHGSSEEQPKVTFSPGEGAAGQAYLTNTVIFQPSLPDYNVNPDLYIKKTQEQYNLSEKKTKDLNRHARSYICFPMKSFEICVKPKAILSIDCMLPDMFYENHEFQEKMLPDITKTIDCSSAEVF